MAKVPTLTQSEDTLKPTPVSTEAASTLGREVVDLGKGVEGLGDYFENLRDFSEKNKAEAALSKGYVDQIVGMANNDPDIHNLPEKIDEATDKLVQTTAVGITSPEVRDKFVESATKQLALKDTHIQGIIRNRQIKDAKNSFYGWLDNKTNEFNQLPPGPLQDIARGQIDQKFDDAVQNGILSQEQADRVKQAHYNKASVDQFYHDLNTAQNSGIHSDTMFSGIDKHLDSGEFYKDLQPNQVSEFKKMVGERRLQTQKLQDKQVKDFQINNEFDALMANASGTKKFNSTDIANMTAQNRMDYRLGTAWIQYLQSPNRYTPKYPDKAKAFYNVSKSVFSSWDKVHTREAMIKMLDAASQGHLGDDEMYELIKASYDRQKALNTTEDKGLLGNVGNWFAGLFHKDSQQPAIQEGFNRVDKHIEDSSDEDKSKAVHHYMSEVNKGTDPSVAADGAIQKADNIENIFPDYKTYPANGRLKYKAGIGYFRVFPDRSWKKEDQQNNSKEGQNA